ncbi:hypothetical protein IW262DRAFT_200327 [Armillaria fumosa]|nr:hypothetical protein IW262DRAFT_200327 [Armillaria fumosa]
METHFSQSFTLRRTFNVVYRGATGDNFWPLLALEDVAEGKNAVPSMQEAIDGLRDMETSLFHTVNYLITQVAICAPSRKETSFTTLEPLRDGAVDFIGPAVEILTNLPAVIDYFSCALRSEPIPESSSAYVAKLYRAMLSNAQLVRDACPPLSAAILSVEAPVITELRGFYGLEAFLRALTWLPWSSSMRVDLLDNLPQLVSAIHSYCQGAMSSPSV